MFELTRFLDEFYVMGRTVLLIPIGNADGFCDSIRIMEWTLTNRKFRTTARTVCEPPLSAGGRRGGRCLGF